MSLLTDIYDEVTMSEESTERIRNELIRRSLEKTPRRQHKKRLLPRTAAAALAAAAVLMTAAFAAIAATHEDFLKSAFGTGISTEPAEMYANDGSPIELPKMDRVEVDSETAEELVGEYVLTVGQSFTIYNNSWKDVTFTVDSLLMDKNGMGVMTYTVTGQNLKYTDQGYGLAGGGPKLDIRTADDFDSEQEMLEYIFAHNGANGSLNCKTYIDGSASTDSEAHLVTYFGSFEEMPEDITLYIKHNVTDGGAFDGDTPLVLTPDILPGITLTAENGDTAEVSAVGIRINYDDIEAQHPGTVAGSPQSIVITFKDGSEYIVKSDEVMNATVLLGMAKLTEGLTPETVGVPLSENIPSNCYTFNRLVDAEDIESVVVTYIIHQPTKQLLEITYTR